MVTLSPDMLGNSLVIMSISYAVVIGFSLVQLYLNWKQARVNNQMAELLEQAKQINQKLAEIVQRVR